jgi:hypothetical protein
MNRNDFLTHLTELGIPHDVSLRECEARYGVRSSTYYDWPVIRISDARMMVPGQVEPPDFQPRLQPDLLPPPHFDAFVSRDTDTRRNHALTLEHLTTQLGTPADIATSNTLGHRWTLDTAFVSILSWPTDLQGDMLSSNPSHEQHPEMNAFVHLTFGAGHVVPLSARERGWMTGARPLPPGGRLVSRQWDIDPVDSPLRGSLRRLPPELHSSSAFAGLSADSAALVAMDGDYGFVLAKEIVAGIDLARSTVRGRTSARLSVRYNDPFTSTKIERSRDILAGESLMSLDEAAAALAHWAEIEATVSEDAYD